MEEWVPRKLLELGYDPERSVSGKPTDVYNISSGHLEGLFLFGGRVVATNNIKTVLEDGCLTVSNVCNRNVVSLYINHLEKRFDDEGISLKDIRPHDRKYIDPARTSQDLGTFCLVVEDARKNNIATFEFWTKGEMLYVPKRVNP